jgi:hypothetical protein
MIVLKFNRGLNLKLGNPKKTKDMKQTIVFMLLVLSIGINAQKYIPFPTENAQWNVFYASSWEGSPMDTVLLRYSLLGDTIINNIQYKKLCRNIGTDTQPIYRGIGGLREQDKRIYYVGESSYQFYNHENLLYDFSKSLGDTVWVDEWRPEKEFRLISYIINKIDSIKIGTEYRKRYNDRFIEGIGDVVGGLLRVITPIPTCIDCQQEWEFVCFSQNGESVYKNPAFVGCNSTRKWSDIPYVPFPTENAQWNIRFISMMYTPPVDTTLLRYSLQGDTIINGTSYHKIVNNTGAGSNNLYKVVGGIREQDKKIYYIGESYEGTYYYSDHEVLLYDFTKQVGDTVWLDQQTNQLNYIIIKTDSVKIGNEFRKRYATERYGATEYIIEGIGNVNSGLFGVITPIPTCIECHLDWQFICFSQNRESVYKNPVYIDCNSIRKWNDIPYVPFPTENASWSEIKWYQGTCDFPCKYQYKMLGDTLINSTLYLKIYKQNDSLANSVNAFYFGALREQAKKIYFRSKENDNEIRLYDFSKNVGDTINNLYSAFNLFYPIPSESAVITGIDSILLNGNYRKVFHLDAEYDDYIWIEGIGCTNGLFNPIIPATTCMCAWHLICYHQNNEVQFTNQNDQIKYLDPNIECFPVIFEWINITTANNSVTIAPNPVTSTSLLKWTGNETFSTLIITNLLGKTIRTFDIRGKSETSLSRSDFTRGIYFVRLITVNGDINRVIKIVFE